jgi:type I protein arginine methyltransferase
LILDLVLKDTESNFDTFSKNFAVVIAKRSQVNALVGWFEVEMTDGIWMSTSPFEAQTHWEQTVFPITSGAYLEEGEVISGQITCKPIATNYRGLDLVFELSISKEASPLIYNYYLQ